MGVDIFNVCNAVDDYSDGQLVEAENNNAGAAGVGDLLLAEAAADINDRNYLASNVDDTLDLARNMRHLCDVLHFYDLGDILNLNTVDLVADMEGHNLAQHGIIRRKFSVG